MYDRMLLYQSNTQLSTDTPLIIFQPESILKQVFILPVKALTLQVLQVQYAASAKIKTGISIIKVLDTL